MSASRIVGSRIETRPRLAAVKEQLRGHASLIAATAALAWVVGYLQAMSWPGVGHDYAYFLPRLLDVHLHYLSEGAGLQWWTPSFGAGLPAFANPQHTQFMPAQWLVFWMDPWRAVVVSNVVLTCVGFLLVEGFVRTHLAAGRLGSIAAALTFATSGFGLHHMMVGHVAFATWPLIAVLPWGFAHPQPVARRIAMLAMTAALIIYAGGYVIIVAWGLCAPLLVLTLWGCAPERFPWRQAAVVFVASIAIAALAAAPKLVAVAEFMRHFPHVYADPVPASFPAAMLAVAAQLTIWRIAVAVRFLTGTEGGLLDYLPGHLWDSDVSLTPVAWLPIALAAFMAIRSRWRTIRWRHAAWLAVATIVGCAYVAVLMQHPSARSAMNELPLLRSLHGNHRLTCALVLPLALATGVTLARLCHPLSPLTRRLVGAAFVALAFVTLLPFEKLRYHSWYVRYDARPLQRAWQAAQAGERFAPITRLAALYDDQVFAERASTLTPYEPVFGYAESVARAGPDFATTLSLGPIFDPARTQPNFHHPPAFVAPATSGAAAFQLAPAGEAPRIAELLQRRQPDWPLTPTLRAANWIGGATLLALLVALLRPPRRRIAITNTRAAPPARSSA